MADLISFESSWQKKHEREQNRKARKEILDKAKADYAHREKRKAEAKEKGEGTWMLDSVNERIEDERKEIKSRKHKKEKKKKHKKEKKVKKRKKSESSSDSVDSDSDESAPGWVEKTSATIKHVSAAAAAEIQGPKLQRDSWMTEAPDFFPAISRQELREQIKKDRGEDEKKESVIEQMGQHAKELNPYWKEGGTGLPEIDPSKVDKSASTGTSVAGDGGVAWMRKAYQRCMEQAKTENRTLEDVATERYGSLEKLESMVTEAERKAERQREQIREERHQKQREKRSPERERYRHRDSSRDRDRGSYRDRDRHNREPNGKERQRNTDEESYREKDRDRYSKSHSDHGDRDRYRDNRDMYSRHSDSNESKSKFKSLSSKFMKPNDDNECGVRDKSRGSRSQVSSSSVGWRKQGFKKPHDDLLSERFKKEEPEVKKRSFAKPRDDEEEEEEQDRKGTVKEPKSDVSSHTLASVAKSRKKKERSRERSLPHSASEDSDSSSSSSEEESSSSSSEEESEEASCPVVEVLSQQQLNELGAKMMRAELMGNMELAAQIKAKIAASHDVKTSGEPTPGGRKKKEKTKEKKKRNKDEIEEEDIVLTRTDRSGTVWPLDSRQHPQEPQQGRRKKEKVASHDKAGKRERYFDDDDKYSLKDLVMREKRSTAEDQNSMFARLAGRSVEKTDEDHQIDDVFMSRAVGKQSDSRIEDKDRMNAIMEHKQMQGSLEKCKRCLEKTTKHLIIAIGIKVYLCLPPHRSLCEGHCLLVPIQHSVASTVLDEDVWNEIKVFRKGLTAMFKEQGKDVVYMETSMHLKRLPHMAIEVIPMETEVGDTAPIYFKKAIQESEGEWTQNKKLIDLSQRDVRRAVPKGFPFFSVDFGLQGGFAHVIEDEQAFPSWFGREIVGGMMDVEPTLWRKPHKENFDDQRKKSIQFADWWKPYDWTRRLKSDDSD